MKRGSTDIVNPVRGTTPINKVMRGGTLVWERGSALPRIYAIAKSAGSRIEFSDDLGATWDTSTLNPSGAGTPEFVSTSIDGQTILIGVWNDNPVQSLNGGSSWAKITTDNLQFGSGGAINGVQGIGYIADLNTFDDLYTSNGGASWAIVNPSPSDSRLQFVGVNSDGIVIAARLLQTQYFYFNGVAWATNTDGSLAIHDLCAARGTVSFYIAHADSVSYIPNVNIAARNTSLLGTDLSVACSGNGVYSLVGDRDSNSLWMSDDNGLSYTNIMVRISTVSTGINLQQNTCISSDGQYMVIPDQGCVHVSDDYGATFTKRTLFFASSEYVAAITN